MEPASHFKYAIIILHLKILPQLIELLLQNVLDKQYFDVEKYVTYKNLKLLVN